MRHFNNSFESCREVFRV